MPLALLGIKYMHEGVTLTCFKAKANVRAHDILVEIDILSLSKQKGKVIVFMALF